MREKRGPCHPVKQGWRWPESPVRRHASHPRPSAKQSPGGKKKLICLSERNKIIREYKKFYTNHAETVKHIKCTKYISRKRHDTLFLSADIAAGDDGTFVTICTLQTNNILLIKHSGPASDPFSTLKLGLLAFSFRPCVMKE